MPGRAWGAYEEKLPPGGGGAVAVAEYDVGVPLCVCVRVRIAYEERIPCV